MLWPDAAAQKNVQNINTFSPQPCNSAHADHTWDGPSLTPFNITDKENELAAPPNGSPEKRLHSGQCWWRAAVTGQTRVCESVPTRSAVAALHYSHFPTATHPTYCTLRRTCRVGCFFCSERPVSVGVAVAAADAKTRQCETEFPEAVCACTLTGRAATAGVVGEHPGNRSEPVANSDSQRDRVA